MYSFSIATSSKDDLYRRIGGRCSTNNMKVVFKVCCAAEEKNKTTAETPLVGIVPAESGIGSVGNGNGNGNGVDNVDLNPNQNINQAGHGHGHGHNTVNTIGISGVNTGLIAPTGGAGMQLKPINGMGTTINSNIDQFNRVPIQPNIIGNTIGIGAGAGIGANGGIMLSPGHGSINMLPPGRGGVHMTYPGHHHIQTGIRINNVPTQQNNQHQPHHKGNSNVNTNGKDTLNKQYEYDRNYIQEVEVGTGSIGIHGHYLPPAVDTNHSNIVQSTINWPILTTSWGTGPDPGTDTNTITNTNSNTTYNTSSTVTNKLSIYPNHTNVELNITSNSQNITSISNFHTPSSHSPPDHGNNKMKSK